MKANDSSSSSNEGERALNVMRNSKYGENAQIIGKITEGKGVNIITNLKWESSY